MEDNPYSSPTAATVDVASSAGRRALVPVAIALLVVSLLWITLSLSGIAFFIGVAVSPDTDPDLKRTDLAYASYLGVEALYCCLLVTGAFSMIGRGSYTWAVVTACLACVPCLSPFYVLGIPIGIWALVVLRRPDTKAAFRKL